MPLRRPRPRRPRQCRLRRARQRQVRSPPAAIAGGLGLDRGDRAGGDRSPGWPCRGRDRRRPRIRRRRSRMHPRWREPDLRRRRLDQHRRPGMGAGSRLRRAGHRRQLSNQRPRARHVRRRGGRARDRCDRICREAGHAGHDLVLAGRRVVGAHPPRPCRTRHCAGQLDGHPDRGCDLGRPAVRCGRHGSQRPQRPEPRRGEGSSSGLDLDGRPELGSSPAHGRPRRRGVRRHTGGPGHGRDVRCRRRTRWARRGWLGVRPVAGGLPTGGLDIGRRSHLATRVGGARRGWRPGFGSQPRALPT